MPVETVLQRWKLTTSLLAGHDAGFEGIEGVLAVVDADVALLQSISEAEVRRPAAGLGIGHVRAFSHHPHSRLIPDSAVGRAVLTPHRITESWSVVVNAYRSKWSKNRRAGHIATAPRSLRPSIRPRRRRRRDAGPPPRTAVRTSTSITHRGRTVPGRRATRGCQPDLARREAAARTHGAAADDRVRHALDQGRSPHVTI